MPLYILIINKLKPKNHTTSSFKIIDVSDIEININSSYNILCANSNNSFTQSGINWDLLNNLGCTINGNLHLHGNLYEYSDIRLKHNISTITNSIDRLSSISGVLFNWIDTDNHDYGIIAQELLKIIPSAVIVLKLTGYKQVNYIKLIPFLLLSIKLLNNRIQLLEEIHH